MLRPAAHRRGDGDPATLLACLVERGREGEATIRERLAREAPVVVPDRAEGHVLLQNSGEVGAAMEILVRHLGLLSRMRLRAVVE